MKPQNWSQLTQEELERLLIERWLYRGLMLGIILVAAILATYIASRGLVSTLDIITIGVLIALALVAAAVSFVIRRHDVKIHQELRRRRGASGQG
ncbi:MAG: hypothetical protein HYV08_14450 [Deltaproteobacteria bacterium]|nr:hypothetical protein [Deltaproteobacteria bacterium]